MTAMTDACTLTNCRHCNKWWSICCRHNEPMRIGELRIKESDIRAYDAIKEKREDADWARRMGDGAVCED
jgi:hypothetical protein